MRCWTPRAEGGAGTSRAGPGEEGQVYFGARRLGARRLGARRLGLRRLGARSTRAALGAWRCGAWTLRRIAAGYALHPGPEDNIGPVLPRPPSGGMPRPHAPDHHRKGQHPQDGSPRPHQFPFPGNHAHARKMFHTRAGDRHSVSLTFDKSSTAPPCRIFNPKSPCSPLLSHSISTGPF